MLLEIVERASAGIPVQVDQHPLHGVTSRNLADEIGGRHGVAFTDAEAGQAADNVEGVDAPGDGVGEETEDRAVLLHVVPKR